jgi:hypothetical protein
MILKGCADHESLVAVDFLYSRSASIDPCRHGLSRHPGEFASRAVGEVRVPSQIVFSE